MEQTTNVYRLLLEQVQLLRPVPKLSLSQWAETHRYLARGGGAPMRWQNSLAPYLIEPMDCVTDPAVETVVFKGCIQVGKTEIINNAIGKYIDDDPCAMLYVQQTLEMGEKYSKEILHPMLQDTPCLKAKVADVRSRDSNSTILQKVFPGGNLSIVGANSPRGFRMMSKRVVICDDVDGFESNVGDEGDPVSLAIGRATVHPDRKILLMSSPTLEGLSRIDNAYQKSDQRIWQIPCPDCGTFQDLDFWQLKWPSPKHENDPVWYAPTHQPEKVRYLCRACGCPIEHRQKRELNAKGQWLARQPFTGMAGFHLNALASAFQTWTEVVRLYLDQKDDPKQYKVFINTRLAETWKLRIGETLSHEALFNRRESYGPTIPARACVLTAGVDVQNDHLTIEVVAWGEGEESWSVEVQDFYGTLTDPNGGAWAALNDFLAKTYEHDSGIAMRIASCCIDSGFMTKEVYKFCRQKRVRGIWPSKGSSEFAHALIAAPKKKSHDGVKLVTIGVSTAKITLWDRLKKLEPGPGAMHFPMHYTQEYFQEFTAEVLQRYYEKGIYKLRWKKITEGSRNEALDRRCYAMGALALLGSINWPALHARLLASSERAAADTTHPSENEQARAAPQQDSSPSPHEQAIRRDMPQKPPRQRGFVTRWRS